MTSTSLAPSGSEGVMRILLFLAIGLTVGSVSVGQEVSWVALVITGVLAVGLFREARGR